MNYLEEYKWRKFLKHIPGQVKFLVCVDESKECKIALKFACMRAKNTNGLVFLLYVIEPQDLMHFAGVENIMKTEAHEKADEVLRILREEVSYNFGLKVQCKIDQGNKYDKIVDLVEEDETISILVLGAAPEGKGSNELVRRFSVELTSSILIPLTVVPGNLSEEELLKIT